MRSVNVNFLRAGQTVADVVCNARGAVLCPMGYVLTDQAIQRLKNANVQTIWIEGNSTPPIDIGAHRAELESRFAGIDDPVLLGIKSLIENRYKRLEEEFSG